MRPSCYSRCKQKKTKQNSGYDFIRGHVISVAFCSMFLNKTKKNYHNLSCADTLFITFFLKVASISFFKNESPLCTSKRHTLDSQPTKSTVQIIHGQFHQTIY